VGRQYNRLSAVFAAKVEVPGRYPDGGGLYLQVRGPENKSWLFRYKRRWQGLGPLRDVTLAEARAAAAKCRKQLLAGIDPIDERRAVKRKGDGVTFKECADRYVAAHQSAWRSPKHAQQWTTSVAAYALPVFGNHPVELVDTGLVLRALEPIWSTKPETSSRVRGRIENVLDWAKARGLREGENPARWRGHLDHLLPAPHRVRAVSHHPALPYAEVPAFMDELRAMSGIAPRCLEFVVLTAARSGEALGSKWSEISGDVWTIPGSRMKSGREHRVPLSSAVLGLLADLPRENEWIFPSPRASAHLGANALREVLQRMGRSDVTPHGFRSAFRDWCAERTNFQRDVAELALAHAVGNSTEAAYRRGDILDKRRRLMAEWARYCTTPAPAGDVVPLHA
jgi:integrase